MKIYAELTVSVRINVPDDASRQDITHAAVQAVEHGEAEVWWLEMWQGDTRCHYTPEHDEVGDTIGPEALERLHRALAKPDAG